MLTGRLFHILIARLLKEVRITELCVSVSLSTRVSFSFQVVYGTPLMLCSARPGRQFIIICRSPSVFAG